MRGKCLSSTRNDFGIIRLILTIGLMLGAAHAHALTSTEYSFDELVNQSDQVMVGTVSDINSFWGEGRAADTIFSHIQLTDLEQIKGESQGNEYSLRVIGGIIGDQAQFYPGLPQFVIGQRYLLFIQGNNRNMFPITGTGQGIYRVQWDAEQQRQIAIPTASGGSLSLTRQAPNRAHQHSQHGQDLESLVNQIRSSLGQEQ